MNYAWEMTRAVDGSDIKGPSIPISHRIEACINIIMILALLASGRIFILETGIMTRAVKHNNHQSRCVNVNCIPMKCCGN